MVSTAKDKLLGSGFQPITEWVRKGDRIKPGTLEWKDSSGWLYAFVVGEEVRYIGLTINALRSRLDQYSYRVGEQGKRVNRLIASEIDSSNAVMIAGCSDIEPDDLEAEENRLIGEFRPSWNRTGY